MIQIHPHPPPEPLLTNLQYPWSSFSVRTNQSTAVRAERLKAVRLRLAVVLKVVEQRDQIDVRGRLG